MEQALSPDLFLFQRIVIDILDYCKKNIRAPPFDEMNTEQLIKNNRKQQIDIYHQYFLQGLANNKTREYVCKKYDQLIRDNLVNKDYLPPNMITSIINYRPSAGSTASSGSGSVGSAISQQIHSERSVHLGKLIATIICHTIQPSSQIVSGLNFLLEGTRNKTYGSFFYSLMEEIYSSLSKYRHSPAHRFSTYFLSHVLNQVEYHEQTYRDMLRAHQPDFQDQSYEHKYIDRSQKQAKEKLCVHLIPANIHTSNYPNKQQAKFGKCFICERDANNFDKVLFVPLCSIDCKNKLKRLNEQCILNDHFNFFNWLLEALIVQHNSEEIVYSLFLRELHENQLENKSVYLLLETIVNNLSVCNVVLSTPANTQINNLQALLSQLPVSHLRVIEHSISIFTEIFKKYPKLLLTEFFHQAKILFYEIIRFMELLPITNSSLQLNILKLMFQILEIETPEGALVIKELYIHTDCHLFSYNLVERVFNILSQYAVNTYTLISGANLAGTGSSISTSSPLKEENTSIISMSSFGSNNIPQFSTSIVSGGDGNQCAINALDKLLGKLCKTMNEFESEISRRVVWQKENEKQNIWQNILCMKSLKKHLQTVFIPNFNKKPIKYIQKLGNSLPLSPKALSLYLLINADYDSKLKKPRSFINKTSLGQLFGSSKQSSQIYYKNYLQFLQLQYEGLEIDDCLRITFNSFSLPKEAQQIQVIFNELSLILQPYLGMQIGASGTATYQWIMATLMVQTSTQPSVKQKQKLKLQDFKGLCSRIDGGVHQSRVIDVYGRINKRPLENLMNWEGSKIFSRKYIQEKTLNTLEEEVGLGGGWVWKQKSQEEKISLSNSTLSISLDKSVIEEKREEKREEIEIEEEIMEKTDKEQLQIEKNQAEEKIEEKQGENEQKIEEIIREKEEIVHQQVVAISESRIESSETIPQKIQNPLSCFLLNMWQHLYVSLVNKNNLIGLQSVCILYGRCEMKNQFETFFNNIYRIFKDGSEKSQSKNILSSNAILIMLHFAIQYGNYMIGVSAWFNIIKIIYRLDEEDKFKDMMRKNTESVYHLYLYDSSDKLFTRSKELWPVRLKQFIDAMCEFSSSQFKTQKKYTREVYILQHMTEIIQYVLQRLPTFNEQRRQSLFSILWPTLKPYFHSISMHPRRQISLAAIDSYKQLTMKILKISFNSLAETEQVHEKLFSVYEYIFERSPSDIRDFLINILLNVVSKDMRAGWQQLFNVLDGSDCSDKSVIMKILGRLKGQLGFERIGSLNHLHSIVVKELRMCELMDADRRENHYRNVLELLWEITQFIDDKELWMKTLASAKDIYKSSNNNFVLDFLYRICNFVWRMPQLKEQQGHNYRSQIYKQIIDVQVHILQHRSPQKLKDALYNFMILNKEIISENLGNEETTLIRSKKRRKSSVSGAVKGQFTVNESNDGIGFLSLWEMFLTGCTYPLIFCKFLKDYLHEYFLFLSNPSQAYYTEKRLLCFRVILLQWLYKLFTSSQTNQILKLCQQDEQLNSSFSEVIKKSRLGVESGKNSKIQLIEFSLSSKQYASRCSQHIIYLDIFKKYCEIFGITQDGDPKEFEENLTQTAIADELKQLQKDFVAAVLESYSTACKVNDRPLLRNFLWHNQFLNSTAIQSYLPGLLKQETHSFSVLALCGMQLGVTSEQDKKIKSQVTHILVNLIGRFSEKMETYTQKQDKLLKGDDKIVKRTEKDKSDNTKIQRDLFYQDLGLWLTNNQFLLIEILSLFEKCIEEENEMLESHLEQILNSCLRLSYGILSKRVIEIVSRVIEKAIDKIY